ncbi:hypothetical protein F5883DRAFT_638920 [Diaporthe sp. PMI_573]|nr:hypothetical protein F5883DRAFT_638920 [Diaporthaceae sp. PMI_573]
MVKLFVQALCLMSAAGTALAMPYADDAHAYSVQDSSTDWPFSELIHESPFDPDTPAAFSAYAPFKANATAPGVSNSSFLISVVNDNDAFEYSGNTYLGWINQPMYSPWNCQQACNALNATGVKCNSYNTFYLRSPTVTPSTDSSCPNPTSMTTIVCALWKNKLYPWDGINTGELRGKNFTVVIAVGI